MAAFSPATAIELAGYTAKMSPASARSRSMRGQTAATFLVPRLATRNRLSAIRSKTKSDEVTITKDEVKEDKMQKELEIQWLVQKVKSMLNSMGDGEVSVSAYDTAWVAMVEDEEGEECQRPRFPSCLEWIEQNQLPDGSWGDKYIFSTYDRILCTLACVIALKKWNRSPHKWQKGLSFLKANIWKLEDEPSEEMPVGFEVLLPSLLKIASTMSLDLPYDSPALCKIYEQQQLKLQRIPMEHVHSFPTTLLHSLEGLINLNWEKLMKLQSEDGSFLSSPSTTAFALMQTKDERCARYLEKVMKRNNGAVPASYPLDLFMRIWAVDRLERLGIARHFGSEIKDYLEYVYSHWKESGIGWAWYGNNVPDLDDTCMGFRLLRKHGYDVSADAFKTFEKDGKFFCHPGQSSEAVTVMCNFNKACQLMFPNEKILEDGKMFTYKFLREKQANNQLFDKWVITKDLPGEVEYALDFPMYASLPRVETRLYLDQYGGEEVVWIDKTLYRMPYVNSNTYLELAKLEFNRVQNVHKSEIGDILRWYKECNFVESGMRRVKLLWCYFLASSVIFEPERASERVAWTKTLILIEAVSKHLCNNKHSGNQIHEDLQRAAHGDWSNRTGIVGALLETLKALSLEAMNAHEQDISLLLCHAWMDWIMSLRWVEGAVESNEGELLAKTINLCGGRYPQQQQALVEVFDHPAHTQLIHLTNSLCSKLRRISKIKKNDEEAGQNSQYMDTEVDSEMKQLIQSVFKNNQKLDKGMTQTFLDVTRTFCYAAYCSQDTREQHIIKVLFEVV